MKLMKKIIIVGSGVGGSGIGALIAKETPHQVHCFEQNNFIGGRCGSYEKKDEKGRIWKLDVGCHVFSTSDKGPIGEILERCGKKIKWSYLDQLFPTLNFMGLDFTFTLQDRKRKKKDFQGLLEEFPDLDPSKYDRITLMDFLDDYFGPDKKNLDKIGFSMAAGVIFGTDPYSTSAGEYLRSMIENVKHLSNGYPYGGTGVIPKAFCDTIKENRGKIFLDGNGRVKRIVVQDNKVAGIEAGPDNEFYEGEIVIANSDIKSTVFKLVGEKYFPKDYLQYISELKWGAQVCSLKIGIDKVLIKEKTLVYVPKMDPDKAKDAFTDIKQSMKDFLENLEIPEFTVLLIVPVSNHDPTLAPEGCQNIHTVTATAVGKIKEWTRDEDKKWEKTCLDTLISLNPEIEDHIILKDFISTSVLATRFGKEGVGTGTAQSTDQVGKLRPKMLSPIKGLYYCSSDVGGWGIGTELAARAALELFQMFKNNNFSNNKLFNNFKANF